jgi:hypothetical protein
MPSKYWFCILCHSGPEPTTDRFIAVMHGPDDRIIPGNALAVHEDLPFTSLVKFGTTFLNRLEASQCNAPLLERITLIDTPGVLSGEKQRLGRSYDFVSVVEYFAERADMILLLFDAHKLDISDEFKRTIEVGGHNPVLSRPFVAVVRLFVAPGIERSRRQDPRGVEQGR